MTDTTRTVTTVDHQYNDAGPSFTINDVSIGEGGTLAFTVTKSGSTALSHNVNYATATGTAGSGDFTATSGTLSFASGDTTKTVNVSTTQDSIYESTERLYVNLSSATNGATIGDSQGYGDTTNDDAGPSFTINDLSITEGGTLAFSVTKSGSTELSHNVNYATAAGTADSGDFTGASGTLSFASGEATKTVNVSTTQDSTYEPTERLYVNLSSATNGATIGDSQGYGDITNDDAPAAPSTPSGPTGTEYTGTYTISWSGVTGADSYRLEERLGAGSWSEIHSAAATSKPVSGKTPGSWEYQVRACNAAGCGGYSGVKTVAVAAPATPATPSGPAFDYDGSYTITWSSVTGAATYTLQERIDAGSWTTIHDAAGTSTNVTGAGEGQRDYQVLACSGAGCSGYSGIATVAIALPPSTTGATPGAIPGGFSVGTQGDASYTIPITVPAGTGGLKPGLALSYSHSAGNGLAGMRWTLSGISAISQCSQTFAQDGMSTGGYDRYCLNGQRLVSINGGTYHADGTQYRTEIESFQRIMQQGSGASTSFYVDHGNGLRSYFGETSNARDVRTWYLSRTVDQFGNDIEYSYYSPSANETLPQTITWTGNSTTNPVLSPRYAVTITYEDRPTGDQRSGYDSVGRVWWRTKRIDEIEVSYDDGTAIQEIATYALTYDSQDPPNGTGRSRLTAVSVCRGAECLPQTVFTVPGSSSGWGNLVGGSHGAASTPLAGDFNGDGRTDLFVSLSNTWQVYPGKADGLFDATVNTSLSSTTNPGQARVFDFNGDGLADLLYQDGSSTWKVAPSNGTTGFDASIDTGVSTSTVVNPMLQDHDGDGLADLVYADTESIYWALNEGGSFGAGGNYYLGEGSVPSFSVGTVDSALRSLDANGDGRADLIAEVEETVCNPSDPYDCYSENHYKLLLAAGSTYTPIEFGYTANETLHYTNFRVGDFNGDGLGDFIYVGEGGTNWVMMISTGTGVTSGSMGTVPVTNAAKVLIADYDGDGRDDFIRPEGHIWYIHRSSGSAIEGTSSAYVSVANSSSTRCRQLKEPSAVRLPAILREIERSTRRIFGRCCWSDSAQ